MPKQNNCGNKPKTENETQTKREIGAAPVGGASVPMAPDDMPAAADSPASNDEDSFDFDGHDLAFDRVLLGSVPSDIFGQETKLEHHINRGGDVGIRIRCSNHPNCRRYRFGPRAAWKYLACWLFSSSDLSENDHRQWRPTDDEVEEFVALMPPDSFGDV